MNYKQISGWIILAVLVVIIIPVTFHIGQLLWGIMAVAALFWISMLIDCLQRSEEGFPRKGKYEKLIWSLTLIFLNLIGAILYFCLVWMQETEKNTQKPEKISP